MWPDRTQPPAVPCILQGNSSGLTHATSPQSRLTPLHPRVPSRGPPPHLQGNSSGLTHATNVAAVPTRPPAPTSASGPGPAFTAAPTMRYGSAFRVTPTQTPAVQVHSRCHLLLLRDGFDDSATSVSLSTALSHGCPTPPPVNTNTQVSYTGPTLRPCHPPLTPELAASDGNDPPTGTSIQRCGDTGTSDTDIRVLCPSRDRPPPTDILPRAWVPLGSVHAWSACLTFMNSLSMTAVVMQTPK